MKKERISNVNNQHQEMLKALEERRQKLTKINKSQPENKCIRKKQSQVDVNIVKLENLPWLEDRSRENIKQWGIRAKIDIDIVEALAAKLKTSTTNNGTKTQIIRDSSEMQH